MTSSIVWFAKGACPLLAGAIPDFESDVSMGGGLEDKRGDIASIDANISFSVLSCRVLPGEGGFANTTVANEDELEFMRDRRLFKKVLIERRPTKMSNNNRIARRPMTKPCGSHPAPDYIANRQRLSRANSPLAKVISPLFRLSRRELGKLLLLYFWLDRCCCCCGLSL